MITRFRRLLTRAAQAGSSLEISGCMVTDPGLVRDRNEDRAAYVIPRMPDLRIERGALALVADGMGGHASGEIASKIAIETVLRTYYSGPLGDPRGALRSSFEAANRTIHESARDDPACCGMGTTCTALAFRGNLAYAAHVGDSRIYLARGGALRQLTDDHSLVMDLVRAGALDRQQARMHADRNVILRALGTRPEVDVAVWRRPLRLQPGDSFLLCSDGLSDLIAEDAILAELQTLPPAQACQTLLSMAVEAGGHDNITVGIFAVSTHRPEARVARATRTNLVVEQ